jgi:hypothetical protein
LSQRPWSKGEIWAMVGILAGLAGLIAMIMT